MHKIILSYDGTHYFGWQKTSSGPSIQEEIEKAIFKISQESPIVEAASRTDRGVHARGQVVSFHLQKKFTPKDLQKALNAHLPKDIRVEGVSEMDIFHPTLDAIGKEYHYHLDVSPMYNPMTRLYSWHIYQPFDLEKMRFAAKFFLGTHDFSAFANEAEKNPICTLTSINCFKEKIIICGDRFLYKMVRNIVGALVYVATSRLKVENIPSLFAIKSRKDGAMTAPAHGLYLHEVFYHVK